MAVMLCQIVVSWRREKRKTVEIRKPMGEAGRTFFGKYPQGPRLGFESW
jgi:hypothetical protein